MMLRVVIAGGGIAGLAAGLALLRVLRPGTVHVTVFERDTGESLYLYGG